MSREVQCLMGNLLLSSSLTVAFKLNIVCCRRLNFYLARLKTLSSPLLRELPGSRSACGRNTRFNKTPPGSNIQTLESHWFYVYFPKCPIILLKNICPLTPRGIQPCSFISSCVKISAAGTFTTRCNGGNRLLVLFFWCCKQIKQNKNRRRNKIPGVSVLSEKMPLLAL